MLAEPRPLPFLRTAASVPAIVRLVLLALLALAPAPAARAQEAAATAAPMPASRAVVVQAARMLDVESGKLVSPARLVVEGGRITAVNPASLPAGAEVIDLGDLTLTPGLIDAHTHLAVQLGPAMQLEAVTTSTADRTLDALANGEKTLLAGFTTVRDLGSFDFIDVALARASERGEIPVPHVIPAGHPLSITGGHGDAGGFVPGLLERDYRYGVADGVDEVVKATRYQIKHGAKVIKIMATAGVLSFEERVGAQQYSDEEMRAIVEEASRHGIPVAAHAHGSEGIRGAVEAGVASIEHGSLLTDEVIELMKEKGTYFVPTTYLAGSIPLDLLPPLLRTKAEAVLPQAVENLKKAIARGVKIAYGTDAGVYPHGDNAKELATLVEERGMDPLAAIQSATLNAADLLRVADDRGRIAPGYLADLIAVAGNPLDDVKTFQDVRFVMKAGTVYKQP